MPSEVQQTDKTHPKTPIKIKKLDSKNLSDLKSLKSGGKNKVAALKLLTSEIKESQN